MGASPDAAVVIASDLTELRRKFNELVHARAWDYGHSGYTGTLAEKGTFVTIPGEWNEDSAYEHMIDENDKWGPAFAYNLGDDRWYIGGWCSS